MRITGIKVYRVELPLHEGAYKWSGGNAVQVFDSTVVAVETDEGLTTTAQPGAPVTIDRVMDLGAWRGTGGELPRRRVPGRSFAARKWSALRRANAITLPCGFTPGESGSMLASLMYRLSHLRTRP